jgi:hypothetical protein
MSVIPPIFRGDVAAPKAKAPAVAAPIDPTAKKINLLHDSIFQAGRTTIKNAIKIGELLTKRKVKAGHGNWLRWVEDNLSFSARTASNYVRIFERRNELKSETLSDLTAAYKLLGILVEPEQLNSKVRIQFTKRPVEIPKVRIEFTYKKVDLLKPANPEPEPHEAEVVSITPNEAEPTVESSVGMTAEEMDKTVDSTIAMTPEEMRTLLGPECHIAPDAQIPVIGNATQEPGDEPAVEDCAKDILAYIDILLSPFEDDPPKQAEVMCRVRDVLIARCQEVSA